LLRLKPLDARIPEWKHDDLVARACPVCRSERALPSCVRPDGLTVRACGACRTFFVSPSPSAAQLDAFYAAYDDAHRREVDEGPRALAARYRRIHPREDLRIRELATLRELRGARVLDVGFGRARMLFDLSRLGAVVSGLELDPKAIELARSLGIEDLRRGTIVDLPVGERFDVIFLNDIVEHLLDPLETLAQSAARLAAGGLLVVATPNGDYARADREHVTFRVDLEHMQYFTPRGCEYLAGRLGLELVHLETWGYPELEGIAHARGERPSAGRRVKSALRALPGFDALLRVRRALATAYPNDERTGSYHLLAIFRLPEPFAAAPPVAEGPIPG
jgi:2-polyprenyl-3-methyl-5-hydroxy-6-metoxy-1,4-benzoquinol methylase